jgi:hypothetical protein
VRRRGPAKQRLRLGPCGYPCSGRRPFAYADAYSYSNSDRNANCDAYGFTNADCKANSNTQTSPDPAPSADSVAAPDSAVIVGRARHSVRAVVEFGGQRTGRPTRPDVP